jgi:hypothetical protein
LSLLSLCGAQVQDARRWSSTFSGLKGQIFNC